MLDFRQILYRRYVTMFKTSSLQMDEDALRSYWVWCEYKFLPLLDKVDRDGSILELGCGPGDMMMYLKKQGFSNVGGIDISDEQVSIAIRRGLAAKVVDAVEFLASNEMAFDLIIAIDFIEHFMKKELLHLFKLMQGALKNNGVLIIQTPNGQALFPQQVIYGDLTHLTIFSPESLQQILRISGFHTIEFYETGPVSKNVKGKIRLVLWGLIKLVANMVRMIETGKKQEIWTENMICFCQKS